MEIRQQGIHHAKTIAGINEDLRFGFSWGNDSFRRRTTARAAPGCTLCSRVFQGAHDRRPDRQNSSALSARAFDGGRNRFRNLVTLRVHSVLLDVIAADGLKSA